MILFKRNYFLFVVALMAIFNTHSVDAVMFKDNEKCELVLPGTPENNGLKTFETFANGISPETDMRLYCLLFRSGDNSDISKAILEMQSSEKTEPEKYLKKIGCKLGNFQGNGTVLELLVGQLTYETEDNLKVIEEAFGKAKWKNVINSTGASRSLITHIEILKSNNMYSSDQIIYANKVINYLKSCGGR